MAIFLRRLLDAAEVPPPEPVDPGFADLEGAGEVTRASVRRLFSHGITGGKTPTTYAPSLPVTRSQMAIFLTRLLTAAGVEPVSGFVTGYDDIEDQDALRRAAIAQLHVLDIMRGVSAVLFKPHDDVTREQMAVLLSQALAALAARGDFTPPNGCDGVIDAYNSVARPSAVEVTVETQEPLLGDSVTVRARLTGREGRPVPGLSVRLVRDGRAPSNYVRTGSDGAARFTVDSPTGSNLTSSIALEVRLGSTTVTSSTTSITWRYPTIDLTGVTPDVAVQASDSSPTVGHSVDIVATVTDDGGTPLFGAELDFIIDGESRGTAFAGPNGQGTFSYDAPFGPPNEGGYDSIQVQVVSTDVVSRPVGVFWQPPESRRITISVSPDRPYSGAARTITAQVFDGSSPLASQALELHIDGTVAGRATTSSEGVASFTRTAAFHGPFDLVKVVLAEDRSVTSNEILLSWPMTARGSHSGNNWTLVWSDEFDGTSLDASKWKAVNNCPPVYLACDTDRPENVYVADGMLHLRTLRERYAGTNKWTSSGNQFGPLTTYTPGDFLVRDFTAARVESTQNFTHGRFEMLGRLPQGHGTFFAFWMRPRNSPYGNDAAGGEIDIAEGANIGRGGNRRGQIDAQLPGSGWGVHHVGHMGYPFRNPFTLTNLPVNPAESFHLYAAEWDTASIRVYVDGQRVLTIPQSDWFSHPKDSDEPVDNPYAPFDQPFFIVINNTVGNWALETWPGHQVPDTTVFPAEFVVDYVRVYECRPPPGTSVPGPGQGCETP